MLVDDALDDLDTMLSTNRPAAIDEPVFLYGHSMGAVIVLTYVLHRGPVVAGVIASAPPLRSALEQQRLKVGLARVCGRLAPALTIDTGLNPEHLSREAAIVASYRHDALVHNRASSALAVRRSLRLLRLGTPPASQYPSFSFMVPPMQSVMLRGVENSQIASMAAARCTYTRVCFTSVTTSQNVIAC